jgi:formylmethanofuran dehydrogenase subunit E
MNNSFDNISCEEFYGNKEEIITCDRCGSYDVTENDTTCGRIICDDCYSDRGN